MQIDLQNLQLIFLIWMEIFNISKRLETGDAMSRYTKQYDKRLTQIINQYEGDGKLLI